MQAVTTDRDTFNEIVMCKPKPGMVISAQAHDNFVLEYKLLRFIDGWEVQVREFYPRTGGRRVWAAKQNWDAEMAEQIVRRAKKEGTLTEETVTPHEGR